MERSSHIWPLDRGAPVPNLMSMCPLAASTIKGIAEGLTSDEMRELRISLAIEHRIDPNEVNARTAWVRIHTDKLLAKFGLSNQLNQTAAIEGLEYCRASVSLSEYKQSVAEFAEYAGVDASKLLKLYDELILKFASENSKKFKDNDGDKVNYEFLTKELWRQQWIDFIKSHFSAEELSKARVLCFPSIQAELEVSKYLELGIRPENIIGVEGGSELSRKLFTLSCSRLGIIPVLGRLEDLLLMRHPPLDKPFDIVNLDFIGPYCDTTFDIAHYLPLSKKCAFAINTLSARESNRTQDDASRLFNLVFNDGLSLEADSRRHQTYSTDESIAKSKELAVAIEELPNQQASEIRSEYYDIILLRELGVYLPTQNPRYALLRNLASELQYQGEKDPFKQDGRLSSCYQEALSSSAAAISAVLFPPKADQSKIWTKQIMLQSYINSLIAPAPSLIDLSRFYYKSEVSKKNSRFNSSFALLQNNPELDARQGRLAKFFVQALYLMMEDMIINSEEENHQKYAYNLRDQNLQRKGSGAPIRKTDRLCFLIDDKYHSDIKISSLTEQIELWCERETANPLADANKLRNIPRNEIC
jgi:hypothetical protein